MKQSSQPFINLFESNQGNRKIPMYLCRRPGVDVAKVMAIFIMILRLMFHLLVHNYKVNKYLCLVHLKVPINACLPRHLTPL